MDNKTLVTQAFNDQPLIQLKDHIFLINPLTEQIPATSAQLLEAATEWMIEVGD